MTLRLIGIDIAKNVFQLHGVDAAAAGLVEATSAGSDGVGVRNERLLKEADVRLRRRLASARPSEKAQLLGLH